MAPKLDDFMQWPEIEALEYGECSRPQDVLGARMADRSHVLVTAYFPEVDSVAAGILWGTDPRTQNSGICIYG